MLGKRPEEVLFAPADRADQHGRVERYVAAQEGSLLGKRTEVICVRGNGETFPAEMAMTIGSMEGLPVFTFFLRDISKRLKAERALRDSEALYHSLVESLPCSVFRKDLQGRFTFANKLCLETLGTTLDELRGKDDYCFSPPELADKYIRDDRRVIETQEIFKDVEELEKAHEGRIYIQVVKTPVYDSKGNIVGTQGIFLDITDRKRAEQELEKAKEAAEAASQAKSAVPGQHEP